MLKKHCVAMAVVFALSMLALVAQAADMRPAVNPALRQAQPAAGPNVRPDVHVPDRIPATADLSIVGIRLVPCQDGYEAEVLINNVAYDEGYLAIQFNFLDGTQKEVWRNANGAPMNAAIRHQSNLGEKRVTTVDCAPLLQLPQIEVIVQNVTDGAGHVVARRTFNVADVIE